MRTYPGFHVAGLIHDNTVRSIYRGKRIKDRLPVLLKIYKDPPLLGERLKRFHRESDIFRHLDSPFVIKILDLLRFDGNAAMVFEDIGGVLLRELIEAGTINIRRLLALSLQMAEMLENIHQNNLIHLALTPHHLYVNPQTNQINLLEFGSAVRIGIEIPSAALDHFPALDPAYVSPEQTGLVNLPLDQRSDLYSLGVIMYEMAAGRPPFGGAGYWETARNHITQAPPPLSGKAADLPKPVVDIIMKLLDKDPESRYWSASGLIKDLTECLRLLSQTGQISPFTLRPQKFHERFQLSRKLYGRKNDLAALEAAFKDVQSGQARLILVSGYAGIGKTVLVNGIKKGVVEQGGRFVSGKFEQFHHNTPYRGLHQAMRELLFQLFCSSESELSAWAALIKERLGPATAVMTEFLPELKKLLGSQPPPAKTGPLESRDRFHHAFIHFIYQFCRPGAPLVLFLDDLQWVDQATLNLITALLTYPGGANLMMIGAYRDNEIDSQHILSRAYNQMKKQAALVDRIKLEPLTPSDIASLIRDSLIESRESAAELAEFVFRKSGGNPFFLTQVLTGLHRRGILFYHPGRQCWEWSAEDAQKMALSEDVVDFLSTQLVQLPPDTQRILSLAACLGFHFDLADLSFISPESLPQTYQQLLPAIRAGLVLPQSEREPSDPDDPQSAMVVFRFRFLHDRVAQTVYTALDDENKKAIHLAIGRRWLETLTDQQRRERLFELTDHLNKGLDLIGDDTQRINLARLNHQAGKKALVTLGIDTASRAFQIARQALPPQSWQTEYDLTFDLYLESAKVAYLENDFTRSQVLIDICLDHADTLADKVRAYDQAIFKYFLEGDFPRAVLTGKKGLALFGIEIPGDITPVLLEQKQTDVMSLLGNRDIASLADLPLNTDPKWDLVWVLVNALGKLIFFYDANLFHWLILFGLRLHLTYGLMKDAIAIFAVNGHILAKQGHIDLGYKLGLLSLELARKSENISQKCFIHHVFGFFILPWKHHLRGSASHIEKSNGFGMMVGEYLYVGGNYAADFLRAFFQGQSVDRLRARLQKLLDFSAQVKVHYTFNIGFGFKSILDDLSGPTEGDQHLDTDISKEDRVLAFYRTQKDDYSLTEYAILKAIILYIHHQPSQCLASLKIADQHLLHFPAQFTITEHAFYYALSLAAVYRDASPEAQKPYKEKMAFFRDKLKFWTGHCPENFSCRLYLVEAEMARVFGRDMEAAAAYEKAIAAAIENEFLHIEALANERAGRFWLAQGHHRIARIYLIEAHKLWRQWGSPRKTDLFEREFLDIFHPGHVTALPDPPPNGVDREIPDAEPGARNKTTLLTAARYLSDTPNIHHLLDGLLKIAVLYTGAQKAFLAVQRNDDLVIEEQFEAEHPGTGDCQGLPIGECRKICLAIVHLVSRNQSLVMLKDAAREGDFIHHDYIRNNRVRSVLCLPAVSQGRLVGLIYLENNLLPGVFTQEQLDTIEIITAQMAMTIDHRELFHKLDTLSQRLEEAQAALKVLWAEKDRERAELEKNTLATLKEVVFPYLERLKRTRLSPEQTTHLKLVEDNLFNLSSAFARHLSSREFGLTPMEIQIAELIKDGRTSDQIADLLHITVGTVYFHRTNIRTKLGLSRQKINLRSHLIALMEGQS